jgi:hypothetical protein
VVRLGSTAYLDTVSYVTSGEVNKDGNTDVLLRHDVSQTYVLLLGDGKGGFTQRAITGGPFGSDTGGTFADVNGDGYADYIAVVPGSYADPRDGCGVIQYGAIVAYLGDGTGKFKLRSRFQIRPISLAQIVVADFNNDGKPDFAVTVYDHTNCGSPLNDEIAAFLGDGKGGFKQSYTNSVVAGPDFVAGDFNKDGRMDLAYNTGLQNGNGDGSLATLEGNGDGSFRKGPTYVFAQLTPSDVLDPGQHNMASGDLNGDGRSDLFVALDKQNGSRGSLFASLLAKVSRGFYWKTAFPGNTYPGDSFSALADMNGDGKLDLLRSVPVANSSNRTTEVYAGKGMGYFAAPQPLLTQSTYAYPQAVRLTKTALPSVLLFPVFFTTKPSFEVLVNER